MMLPFILILLLIIISVDCVDKDSSEKSKSKSPPNQWIPWDKAKRVMEGQSSNCQNIKCRNCIPSYERILLYNGEHAMIDGFTSEHGSKIVFMSNIPGNDRKRWSGRFSMELKTISSKRTMRAPCEHVTGKHNVGLSFVCTLPKLVREELDRLDGECFTGVLYREPITKILNQSILIRRCHQSKTIEEGLKEEYPTAGILSLSSSRIHFLPEYLEMMRFNGVSRVYLYLQPIDEETIVDYLGTTHKGGEGRKGYDIPSNFKNLYDYV